MGLGVFVLYVCTHLVGDDENAVARAREEAVDLDLDALARVC